MPSSEMALLGKHFSGIRFLLLTFITVASTSLRGEIPLTQQGQWDFSEDLEMTLVYLFDCCPVYKK